MSADTVKHIPHFDIMITKIRPPSKVRGGEHTNDKTYWYNAWQHTKVGEVRLVKQR